VSNAERYRFADFTRDNYSRLLQIAKQAYPFKRYTDFARTERFVLWRHDVDFSPHSAVKLAEREAEAGVPAMYFALLHSDFYNLLERDVSDCIRTILGLGHDVGLHFDLSYYPVRGEEELVRWLAWERHILEDTFQTECRVFSFHNPDAAAAVYRGREYAGLINAAAAYFFEDVGFCSDSYGYWRTRRLEDVLRQATEPRLQVLTHPEMWQDAAMSPRQRVNRCIDGRAQKVKERHERFLRARQQEPIDDA
jgi:hypothetical protein